MPLISPPPPTPTTTTSTSGRSSRISSPALPWPGDDRRVVEWVAVDEAALRLELPDPLERLADVGTVEHDLGAVPAGRHRTFERTALAGITTVAWTPASRPAHA